MWRRAHRVTHIRLIRTGVVLWYTITRITKGIFTRLSCFNSSWVRTCKLIFHHIYCLQLICLFVKPQSNLEKVLSMCIQQFKWVMHKVVSFSLTAIKLHLGLTSGKLLLQSTTFTFIVQLESSGGKFNWSFVNKHIWRLMYACKQWSALSLVNISQLKDENKVERLQYFSLHIHLICISLEWNPCN